MADGAGRQLRPVSNHYSTVAGTPGNFGDRFDHEVVGGRHWTTGRVRNDRAATSSERRSGTESLLVVDSGNSGGGGHSAPLNLTCQTAERRSETATPHRTSTVSRHDGHKDPDDWSGLETTSSNNCWPINGVAQRRSMSARSDADERPLKERRRTCWSVDNISNQPRSPPTLRPAYDDRLDVQGRQQCYRTSAVGSYQQKDAMIWQRAQTANSMDFPDYCNDVVTTAATTPAPVGHSSSCLGVHGTVGLAEPVAAWSKVHLPSHDSDPRPSGGIRDGPARECSVVAQDQATADDDDDDALRQLLRLIQQPDGQPVFLCRHCDIIYADRMLYVLHMGLHNVNNPWQCNICGTTCSGRQQFALHALHY